MANDSITFYCPACGIKLTVPFNLAGVIGPCPTCRTQIQAPQPISQPVVYLPPAPPPPRAPNYADPGTIEPPVQIPQPPTQSVTQSQPATLKPEPRQLPNRPHLEPVARQMPEPTHSDDPRKLQPAPLPKHPHQSGLLSRCLMLIVLLLASGALVFGVLTVLKSQADKEYPMNPASKPGGFRRVDGNAPPKQSEPETKPAIQSLPVPTPAQPTLIEPVPELPEGMKPQSQAMESLEVLEKFLAAKSLAERIPMIETKTSEAELAASCLAKPLPPTRSVLIDAQESNPMEEVVDFYYNVDFEAENNRVNPQTLLVRIRGRGEPKVVVDPFLDLFGGRLAAYAAKPIERAGEFQAIVYAVASCSDPKIPNRDKKLTLKLLARDNTKEIAQAYFGKLSKIGEMLEDGTYSLSYGNAKSCTVLLRWNTEDVPEYPYLEAVAVKALDWNP